MAKLFITSNANNNNKKSVRIAREKKKPITGKKQNHPFGIESS